MTAMHFSRPIRLLVWERRIIKGFKDAPTKHSLMNDITVSLWSQTQMAV